MFFVQTEKGVIYGDAQKRKRIFYGAAPVSKLRYLTGRETENPEMFPYYLKKIAGLLLKRKGASAMPDAKKECGQWGNFLFGDRVSYLREKGVVAAANPDDVPKDYVPIKFDFNGAVVPVPIKKVVRIRQPSAGI